MQYGPVMSTECEYNWMHKFPHVLNNELAKRQLHLAQAHPSNCRTLTNPKHGINSSRAETSNWQRNRRSRAAVGSRSTDDDDVAAAVWLWCHHCVSFAVTSTCICNAGHLLIDFPNRLNIKFLFERNGSWRLLRHCWWRCRRLLLLLLLCEMYRFLYVPFDVDADFIWRFALCQ